MSSRRGPWPAGACVVGLPFESFLAPQAAFGCHRPWGVGGLGTVSRHPAGARGGGGGGVAPSGPPSFAVPPLAVVFAGARPARPSAPRLPPAVPFPPCARGPCPLPAPHAARAPSGRAARARGRVRVRVRAPGTRAPAATRGTPRRLPAAARSPPGLRPCRGSRPGAPAARAVAVAVAWWGGGRGRAVRPSPVRASAPVRAPTRPLPNPGRLSAGPRPVRPVTAGSCSPSRPASVSPSLSAARGRRRPRPRRRRLLLPEGATGGRRWSVGVLCWCAGKGGRPGAVGRGSLCPLLGTLLAGAPAARARARPPRRDLRSDVATR